MAFWKDKAVLITGGAGFIGTNLCRSLLNDGARVTVFDNLSRKGTERNLERLNAEVPSNRFGFVRGDVGDFDATRDAVAKCEVVFHFAGQVAVTTSVLDPRSDFDANLRGTFNALEAARLSSKPPIFLYTSTNKVYGRMSDEGLVEQETRYVNAEIPQGFPESQPLDFHSPYGCSKGAGDQYVLDYARIYGLDTVVFRMSCIYGPWQYGNEDQGWVAHFARAFLAEQPLTICGNGKQVRDVLFVEDLVRAQKQAAEGIEQTRGRVFNIGGGPERTLSLLELLGMLKKLTGRDTHLNFTDWRPGDQKWYVSDVRKAARMFGWTPSTPVETGVARLLQWIRENVVGENAT